MFLQKPFSIYEEELKNLYRSGGEGKYKFCALALCVIYNNHLEEKYLIGKDTMSNDTIVDTLDACELNKSTSGKRLKTALDTLQGTFISKDDGVYRTIHDKLFDFLAHYFGKRIMECLITHAHNDFIQERFLLQVPDEIVSIEDFAIVIPDRYLDLYIDRIFKEWSKSNAFYILRNRNRRNRTFRKKLLNHIKQLDKAKTEYLIEQASSEFIRGMFLRRTGRETELRDIENNNILRFIFEEKYKDVFITLPESLLNIYIKRIVAEWLDGNIYGVFFNINMESPSFRQIFVNYIKQFDRTEIRNIIEQASSKAISTMFQWETLSEIECTKKKSRDELSIIFDKDYKDMVITLPDCLVDKYFMRMVFDWSDGNISDVINNRNIRNPSFRQKFLNYITQLDKSYQSELLIKTDIENQDSALTVSIYVGDIELSQWILDHNVSVTHCNRHGESALFKACQYNHLSVVDKLIERGANIDECDKDGRSPVYMAGKNGHVQIVGKLIECGANIDKCDRYGRSPLYMACENGHVEVVSKLIECSAKLDECDKDRESPLYRACENGNIQMACKLLEYGANFDMSNKNGESPLYKACSKNHIDTVSKLIEYGANVNICTNNGESPLFSACQEGYADIVSILLKQKTVDINKCKHTGDSPLHIACVIGNKQIVELLLSKDADVNMSLYNHQKISEAVVKYDNDTVDNYKETLKNFVDRIGSPCVKSYIHKMPDDRVFDIMVSSSPLHLTCFMGHTEIVKLILEKNPEINILKEDGTTPIFLACELGHECLVRLLLENGARADICRKDGKSPSIIAAENGHTEIVSLLHGRKVDDTT